MNIMTDWNLDLRLRDLRILSIALRERNLTRTAESLGTTQPSISKVLARLRAHFGDPLFTRNGSEMHPTPKLIEIEGTLRTLLASADDLSISTPTFIPATSTRTFKILVSEVGMVVFLPTLMQRVASEGPNLSVDAVPLDARPHEAKLESGEADLALGAFPKSSPGLKRQRLYPTTYLSMVRANHPNQAALKTRAGFLSARHIVVTASNTGHAGHRNAQQSLDAEIPSENVMLRLPSFTAAAVVASQTDGIATLPMLFAKIMAEQLGLVTFKPPVSFPPLEIAQYWHERFHRDAGHKWLRAISFDLFAKGKL
jgi:DNA-binding transcriptional LysR family regulator